MSKRGACAAGSSASPSAPPAKRARSVRDTALLAEFAAQEGSNPDMHEYALDIYRIAMGEAGFGEEEGVAAAEEAAVEIDEDDEPPAAAASAAAAGERPRRYACSESLCGAVFSAPSKLQRHVEAVHLGLKPHACNHCEAAFASVSHLKVHLSSVHLGLKPYECEWCVAAYTSSSSLKAHMASAHPEVAWG